MNKKDNKIKKYIILFGIYLITIMLVFYISSWYKTVQEHYKNNSVIPEVVSEITAVELESFVIDNPNIIVYVASSSDETIKDYEKILKKMITDNDIQNEVVYINLDKEENINLIDTIKVNYLADNLKKISTIFTPNLFYFEDGKITDMVYIRTSGLTKNNTENFFERNGIINND